VFIKVRFFFRREWSCLLSMRILIERGRRKKVKVPRIEFDYLQLFTPELTMVKEQFRETNVASEVYVNSFVLMKNLKIKI